MTDIKDFMSIPYIVLTNLDKKLKKLEESLDTENEDKDS